MKRTLVFAYGLASYAVFFCTYLYAFGFVANVGVPRSIDSAPRGPLGVALAINAGLLALFAVQHSAMARPAFKRWWARFVPEPAERGTYVLLSSLALILLFWLWRPIGGLVWDVSAHAAARVALQVLCAAGFGLVFWTTFLINHFDLFGLRQVWLYFRGRAYAPLLFVMPGPYRLVRHSMYVGWFLAFWSTPTMTAAHLLFAVLTTVYILVAIQLEERDLVTSHGSDYEAYRRRVPMLVPRLTRRAGEPRGVERLAALGTSTVG